MGVKKLLNTTQHHEKTASPFLITKVVSISETKNNDYNVKYQPRWNKMSGSQIINLLPSYFPFFF